MKLRTRLFRLLFAGEYAELEQLRPLRRPPPRFERHPAWTEEQIAEILAGTAPAPIVKAIHELIDVRWQSALEEAGDPAMPHAETKYHQGEANALLLLKSDLQARTEAEKRTAQAES